MKFLSSFTLLTFVVVALGYGLTSAWPDLVDGVGNEGLAHTAAPVGGAGDEDFWHTAPVGRMDVEGGADLEDWKEAFDEALESLLSSRGT